MFARVYGAYGAAPRVVGLGLTQLPTFRRGDASRVVHFARASTCSLIHLKHASSYGACNSTAAPSAAPSVGPVSLMGTSFVRPALDNCARIAELLSERAAFVGDRAAHGGDIDVVVSASPDAAYARACAGVFFEMRARPLE